MLKIHIREVKFALPCVKISPFTSCFVLTDTLTRSVEELMEDLDDILGDEIASFQEVFEQFQVKDKKAEERTKHEQADLQTLETKSNEVNKCSSSKGVRLVCVCLPAVCVFVNLVDRQNRDQC